MVGAYTGWVVSAGAVVADDQAIRDRTVNQLPRHVVSCAGVVGYLNSAVTLSGLAGRPDPAFAGLINLGPEPSVRGLWSMGRASCHHAASLSACLRRYA